MTHPSDEQLSDYLDRALNPADHVEVARHLEHCTDCALVVAELQRVIRETSQLGLLVPPPHVWTKVEGRIAKRTPKWAPIWALATAALVVLAFLIGRFVEHRPSPVQQVSNDHLQPASVPSTAGVRERVLLIAVGDHLERSQMVLVELANAQTQDELDISAERQSADELLASNRLYRQTAAQIGQTSVAEVLDDLERVLVEVARGPSRLSIQQLAEIQQRIEAQGILFKVKIIRNNSEYR